MCNGSVPSEFDRIFIVMSESVNRPPFVDRAKQILEIERLAAETAMAKRLLQKLRSEFPSISV